MEYSDIILMNMINGFTYCKSIISKELQYYNNSTTKISIIVKYLYSDLTEHTTIFQNYEIDRYIKKYRNKVIESILNG